MTDRDDSEPISYDQEVHRFAVGPLRIGHELDAIASLSDSQAPEAVVFYCARILEALARKAATSFCEGPDCDVFGALVRLADAGMLSDGDRSSCHGLRRLGNDVRHVRRAVEPQDAAIARALVDRVLVWFFVSFPLGPRARTVHRGAEHPSERDELLVALLAWSGAPHRVREDLVSRWRSEWDRGLSHSPVLPALLAEILLEAGRHEEALGVCELALPRFSTDLRLRQLAAWAVRESGRADQAIERLEALLAFVPGDGETLGLLAGTYKRVATGAARIAGVDPADALAKAQALYERAWDGSRYTNTYCGVNAATLALLQGQRARATKVAKRVLRKYDDRRAILAPGSAIRYGGYWDRATHAEALLLAGEIDAARAAYVTALGLYAARSGMVASTLAQLSALLGALELSESAASWLERPTPSCSASIEPLPCIDEPAVTKTYSPKPIDTHSIELDPSLVELMELLAANNHDHWARRRLDEGWRFGPARDDQEKTHPHLVPYEDLPESEKEYDRAAARETLRTLIALGYRIDR